METDTIVIGERDYMSAVYSAATYNQWLLKDRLQRIPCLERQTQRRHGECTLWYHGYQRLTDNREGYLYTYPYRIEPQKNVDPSHIFDYDIPLCQGMSQSGDLQQQGDVLGSSIGNGTVQNSSSLYIDIDEALLYANQQQLQEEQSLRDSSQLNSTPFNAATNTPHAFATPVSSANMSTSPLTATRGKKRKPGRPGRVCPEASLFRCQYCESSYRTKGGLVYHLTHKHRPEQLAERQEQQQQQYTVYTPSADIPTATTTTTTTTNTTTATKRKRRKPAVKKAVTKSPPHYDLFDIRDSAVVHLEDTAINGNGAKTAATESEANKPSPPPPSPVICQFRIPPADVVKPPGGAANGDSAPAAYLYCNGNNPYTSAAAATVLEQVHSDLDDDVALITVKKKRKRRRNKNLDNVLNGKNNNNIDSVAGGKEHKKKRKKKKKKAVGSEDEVDLCEASMAAGIVVDGEIPVESQYLHGDIPMEPAQCLLGDLPREAEGPPCVAMPLTIPVSVSLMHIDGRSNCVGGGGSSDDTESYSLQEEQDY